MRIESQGSPKIKDHPQASGLVEMWLSLDDRPDPAWVGRFQDASARSRNPLIFGKRILADWLVVDVRRQNDAAAYRGWLRDHVDRWIRQANEEMQEALLEDQPSCTFRNSLQRRPGRPK